MENSTILRLRAAVLDGNTSDRNHLKELLKRHPSIELCGEASTLKEALSLISSERIDVLFLETESGGDSIFDNCELIPPSVRLIFVTGNPSGAWRAFELDAVDFLVKPLLPARLAETVRRMLRLDWQRPEQVVPPADSMMLIPFERGRRGVSTDDMIAIQAFGNYSRVALQDGKSEIVLRSLARWEKLLPMPPFLRVHRNALVNGGKVRRLDNIEGGTGLVMEHMDEPIAVSRRSLPEVRNVLFENSRRSAS